MRFVVPTLLLIMGSCPLAQAQIAVQQPVVGAASVRTSVSIPDRGTVFLGGVSSAASARSTYGPLRTGENRGSALTSTSMSAKVYIIDLHEMDEAILNSVPDSPSSPTIRGRSSAADGQVAQREEPSAAVMVAKFEKLALQAESAGKSGVAKLHWKMAAKYGSAIAQAKLDAASATVAQASEKKP